MKSLYRLLGTGIVQKVAKVFTGDMVAKVIAFVAILILANYLSVEEFGRYNYFFYILSLVSIISEPFFSSYLRDFRYYKYSKFDLGVALIPFALIPVFLLVIWLFNRDIPIATAAVFSVYFILFSMLKTYLNVYERYGRFSMVNILNQLNIFIGVLVVVILFHIYEATPILFVSYSLGFFTILLFCFLFMDRKSVTMVLHPRSQVKNLNDSKFLLLYVSIIPIINVIDVTFVEKFLAPDELGYYSFALRVYGISISALGAIMAVMNIRKIDIVRNAGVRDYISKYWKKALLLSLAAFVVMVMVSLVIIKYITPGYMPAMPSIMILLLGASCSYMLIPFTFLIPLRKYRAIFMLSLLALLADIMINYFFIGRFGMIAAAFATFSAHFIINAGNLFWSYVYLKKNKL